MRTCAALAVLGLLTNSYSFRVLYNYNEQILTVAEYTQASLIAEFTSFLSFSAKKPALNLVMIYIKANKKFILNFLIFILSLSSHEDMFKFLEQMIFVLVM